MVYSSDIIDAAQILRQAGVLPGMQVVDLGVGKSAYFTRAASNLVGEDGVVHAVDISPDVLKMLVNHCSLEARLNVNPVWGDYEAYCGIPVEPESIDLVVAVNIIWPAEDLAEIVREGRRLLKSQGRFVLVDWHPQAQHPLVPVNDRLMSAREARQVLLSSDFQRIDDLYAGQHHWGFKCFKP